MREVQRVLELEAASYKTPERGGARRADAAGDGAAGSGAHHHPRAAPRPAMEEDGRDREAPPQEPRSSPRAMDPDLRMALLCGLMGVAAGGVVSSAWRVQVEDGPVWL